MNFVPYDNSTPSWAWPILIATVVLLVLGIVLYSRGSKGSKRLANTGAILLTAGALGMFSILGIGLAQMGINGSHRTEAVSSQIEEDYGLKLSEIELSKLDYPFSKPDSNFEVFGHIDKQIQTDGTSFSEKRVYLVWADGKLGLSESSNGEDYTALEPREEADR